MAFLPPTAQYRGVESRTRQHLYQTAEGNWVTLDRRRTLANFLVQRFIPPPQPAEQDDDATLAPSSSSLHTSTESSSQDEDANFESTTPPSVSTLTEPKPIEKSLSPVQRLWWFWLGLQWSDAVAWYKNRGVRHVVSRRRMRLEAYLRERRPPQVCILVNHLLGLPVCTTVDDSQQIQTCDDSSISYHQEENLSPRKTRTRRSESVSSASRWQAINMDDAKLERKVLKKAIRELVVDPHAFGWIMVLALALEKEDVLKKLIRQMRTDQIIPIPWLWVLGRCKLPIFVHATIQREWYSLCCGSSSQVDTKTIVVMKNMKKKRIYQQGLLCHILGTALRSGTYPKLTNDVEELRQCDESLLYCDMLASKDGQRVRTAIFGINAQARENGRPTPVEAVVAAADAGDFQIFDSMLGSYLVTRRSKIDDNPQIGWESLFPDTDLEAIAKACHDDKAMVASIKNRHRTERSRLPETAKLLGIIDEHAKNDIPWESSRFPWAFLYDDSLSVHQDAMDAFEEKFLTKEPAPGETSTSVKRKPK